MLSPRFENKVLLITGATGIGAAAARMAAREGARTFVTSLHEGDCLDLVREIGGGFHAGDLRQASVVQEAIDFCLDRYQRIDGLLNVAGISGRRLGDGPVHECTEEGWIATMENNVRTAFLMSRAVLRQMLAQDPEPDGSRGAIVNMTSVLAFSPEPRHFATHAYAASKGALIALTTSMASHYARFGIRVNALAPALVRTPMSARAQEDPAILEYMHTKQPLAGNLMEPEDIARAALFLLSEAARMITGQVLAVDAGWSVSGS